MQSKNPSMPTRVIENETEINMNFGDTVLPGILNDRETAQATKMNIQIGDTILTATLDNIEKIAAFGCSI